MVGAKSGALCVWRLGQAEPNPAPPASAAPAPSPTFAGLLPVHGAWATCSAWAVVPGAARWGVGKPQLVDAAQGDRLLLATGGARWTR